MTTYTISPIPTSGGTMSIDTKNSAWVHIGGNKFMILFAQTNPAQSYAQIITYNHMAEPDNGMAQVIRSNTDVAMRAVSVANSKVLVFYLDTATKKVQYQFLTYDASDNITAGDVKDFVTIYQATSAGTFGIGKMSDTVIRLHYSTTANTRVLKSFNVNTTSETIVEAGVGYGVDSSVTSNYTRCYRLLPIPGTTRFYEYAGYGSTTANTANVSILNADGTQFKVLTSTTTPGFHAHFFPLSATKLISVHTLNTSGGTTNGVYVQKADGNYALDVENMVTARTLATTNVTNKLYMPDIVPISEYHFMVINAAYKSGTPDAPRAMVMRFLDDDYVEVSQPTDTSGGLGLSFTVTPSGFFNYSHPQYPHAINTQSHYLGQPSFHKLNDSTILYWFVSNNQFCYKIIYQKL